MKESTKAGNVRRGKRMMSALIPIKERAVPLVKEVVNEVVGRRISIVVRELGRMDEAVNGKIVEKLFELAKLGGGVGIIGKVCVDKMLITEIGISLIHVRIKANPRREVFRERRQAVAKHGVQGAAAERGIKIVEFVKRSIESHQTLGAGEITSGKEAEIRGRRDAKRRMLMERIVGRADKVLLRRKDVFGDVKNRRIRERRAIGEDGDRV